MSDLPAAALAAVAEALAVHRWKTMGVASVECECGAILEGDADPFPADEAFRSHIAAEALAAAAPHLAAAERTRANHLSGQLREARQETADLEHLKKLWTDKAEAAEPRIAALEQTLARSTALGCQILAEFDPGGGIWQAEVGHEKYAKWAADLAELEDR